MWSEEVIPLAAGRNTRTAYVRVLRPDNLPSLTWAMDKASTDLEQEVRAAARRQAMVAEPIGPVTFTVRTIAPFDYVLATGSWLVSPR
jgi:hypothetical protein